MKELAKYPKKLSKKEQDTIIGLKEAGWSNAVISEKLNIDEAMIGMIIEELAKYPKKLSKKELNTIIGLKETGWSDAVIAKVLNAKGEK